MLKIKRAIKIFNSVPLDPYVVLPGTDIEVRFSDDGKFITYAFDARAGLPVVEGVKEQPSRVWKSDEFAFRRKEVK